MAHESHRISLPFSLVGPADLSRVRRELYQLNDKMSQGDIRHEEEGMQSEVPKPSHTLNEIIEINKIDISHKEARDMLIKSLDALSDNAPKIHVSFSADPSSSFLEKLMQWLRNNIDEHVLVTIGLEPSIGAGCIVRTKNKYFDLSMKQNLQRKRGELTAQLLKDTQSDHANAGVTS